MDVVKVGCMVDYIPDTGIGGWFFTVSAILILLAFATWFIPKKWKHQPWVAFLSWALYSMGTVWVLLIMVATTVFTITSVLSNK